MYSSTIPFHAFWLGRPTSIFQANLRGQDDPLPMLQTNMGLRLPSGHIQANFRRQLHVRTVTINSVPLNEQTRGCGLNHVSLPASFLFVPLPHALLAISGASIPKYNLFQGQ